ncbi:Serine/threonine-protein phosphatase 7 long form [Glycine max]|nr:Serine/threonine-protein phosphatase 7 long form [Glycine max]
MVQLMVTFYGCKISMFQYIFGMRKKIENYTLDELSPRIKVKKKYTKLFLYFSNLCLDRKIDAENIYFSHEMKRVHYYSSRCICFIRSPCGWADLCEELLGVRLEEGVLQGSMIKLNWLAQHFPELNNHDDNLQQVERFTRAWILRFIGGVLFVDKGSSKVSLRECNTYAWGPAVLAYLYREMCSATDYKLNQLEVATTWKSTYRQ